jgi:hypothetical protein
MSAFESDYSTARSEMQEAELRATEIATQIANERAAMEAEDVNMLTFPCKNWSDFPVEHQVFIFCVIF